MNILTLTSFRRRTYTGSAIQMKVIKISILDYKGNSPTKDQSNNNSHKTLNGVILEMLSTESKHEKCLNDNDAHRKYNIYVDESKAKLTNHVPTDTCSSISSTNVTAAIPKTVTSILKSCLNK